MNNFAQLLQNYRTKNDLTIIELAQKLNCSPSVTSYYERGLRSPSLNKMIEICKILNIPAIYLIYDENELPAVPASPPVATAKE